MNFIFVFFYSQHNTLSEAWAARNHLNNNTKVKKKTFLRNLPNRLDELQLSNPKGYRSLVYQLCDKHADIYRCIDKTNGFSV